MNSTRKAMFSINTLKKIVAVLTAISLVFLQVPVLGLTEQARADAANSIQEQIDAAQAKDIPLTFEHAYIVYDKQTIAEPATKVTLPGNADLSFKAQADNGYQMESVVAVIGDAETKLVPNENGEYKLTASEVAALKSIAVKAVTAPTAEDVTVAAPQAGGAPAAGESADEPAGQEAQGAPAQGEAAQGAPAQGEAAQEPPAQESPSQEPSAQEQEAQTASFDMFDVQSSDFSSSHENFSSDWLATSLAATGSPRSAGAFLQAASTDSVGETAITGDNASVTVAVYRSASDRSSKTNAITDDYEISISETLYGAVHFDFKAGYGPTTGRLTYTYTLPNNIKAADKAVATLYDDGGNVAGTWEIRDNVVYFYYKEAWALAHPTGGGNFNFDFSLDEEEAQTGGSSSFSFPGATETVTVKVREAELTGGKWNSGVTDGVVTFTVNLNAQTAFDSFIFKDHMEKNLHYVPGSFTFDGQPFAVTIKKNADGTQDASAPARSIAKGSHTVTYQATVDQAAYDAVKEGHSLHDSKNTATWEYSKPGQDPKTGTSTSKVELYKDIISKSAPASVVHDNELKWQIKVNGSSAMKSDIGGYTVTDTLKEGMTYGEYFKVYDADKNEIDRVAIPAGAKSFSYTFPADAGANKYYIKYSTFIVDTSKAQTFKNYAEYTPGGGSSDATFYYNPEQTPVGVDVEVPEPNLSKEVQDQSKAQSTGVVTWHSQITSDLYPAAESESGMRMEYVDSLEKWENQMWVSNSDSNESFARIWFMGEPTLYVNGTKLVKGVDYQFEGSSGNQWGNSYGFTKYKDNFEGNSMPIEFRVCFLMGSDTMKGVVQNKLPIDIYYDTQSDGTFQKYYNDGTVEVYEDGDKEYTKSAEADYTLTGESKVTKTGAMWWDDSRNKYVAEWELVANRADNWDCMTDLRSPYFTFVDTLPEGMTVVEDSISLQVVRPQSSGLSYVSCYPEVEFSQDGRIATFSVDLTKVRLESWQQPLYDEATGSCFAWGRLEFETELDPAFVVHDGTEQLLHNTAVAMTGEKSLGTGQAVVSYTDKVISKRGSQQEGEPVVHYTIQVNDKAQKLDADASHTTVNLKDTLDYRSTVVLSSIAVTDTKTGRDITGECSVKLSNNEVDAEGHATSSFTVNVPDERAVTISYDVKLSGVAGQTYEITNSATLSGITENQTTSKQWFKVNHADASVYGSNTVISLTKTDSSNVVSDSSRLAGAVFELYAVDMDKLPDGPYTDEGLKAASTLVNTATTDDYGSAVLYDEATKALQFDTLYYFKEVQAPFGYAIDDTRPHFVMTAGSNYSAMSQKAESHGISASPNTTYNVTDTMKTATLLKARKVLADGELEAGAFTFELRENGRLIETATNDASGTVAFSNIEYSAAGTHVYTISEVAGDKDYITYDNHAETVTVTVKNAGNGRYAAEAVYASGGEEAVFTNTYHATGSAKLEVTKTLNNIAPASGAFSFTLSGPDGDIQTVSNDAAGTAAFDELAFDAADITFDGVDDEGNRYAEITYNIRENVPEGAKAVVGGKALKDGMLYDVSSHSVTVRVTDDGEGTLNTTYDGDTTFAGAAFENERKTVDITGTKSWDDADNQDGIRTGSVTLHLLADNADTGRTAVATAGTGWTFSFTGLPKTDSNGKDVAYTVVEDVPEGYTAAYSGSAAEGVVVTNTHVPEVTQVPVRKVWDDAENQDGMRKDRVWVNLLANGEETGQRVKLTEEGGWSYTFVDLPIFKDGERIAYSVKETTSVDGYEKPAYGTDGDTLTVTNRHTPQTTSVSGTKSWQDAANADGNRPSSVVMHLLADGEEVASQTATEQGGWSYSFANLPVYKAGAVGQKIVYTVVEGEFADYAPSAVDGGILNTYERDATSVKVTKAWDDENDKDGIRPSSVEVQLLANGNVYDSANLSSANGWTYTWTDLPKRLNGAAATYTVAESAVEGYELVSTEGNAESGFVMTNKHVPETGDVPLVLYKTSATNSDARLMGAQFTATNVSDPANTETVTTGLDGAATFTKLKRGQTYSVQETVAPGGYKLDETVYTITLGNEDVPTITCANDALDLEWNDALGYWTTIEDQPDGDFGSIIISKTLVGADGVWGNVGKHPEIDTVRQGIQVSVVNIDTGDNFTFQAIGNAARYTRKVDLYDASGAWKGQVTITPSGSMASKIANLPSGTWQVTETADGMTSFDGENAARSGSSDTWTRTTTYSVDGSSTQYVGTSANDDNLKTLDIANHYYGNGKLILTKQFGWEYDSLPGKYAGNLLGGKEEGATGAAGTIMANITFKLTGQNLGETYIIRGNGFNKTTPTAVASESGDTAVLVTYSKQQWTVENLPYDTYTVEETSDGYRDNGEEIDTILHKFYTTGTFDVTKDSATTNVSVGNTTGETAGEGVSESGASVEVNGDDAKINVLNVYYRPKVVEATKTWSIPEGVNYTPQDIQVQLVRSVNGVDNEGKWQQGYYYPVTSVDIPEHPGYETRKTLHWNSATNSYDRVVFSQLPAVTANGEQITYEVREVSADGTLVQMVNGSYTDENGNVLQEGNTYIDSNGATATATWGDGWSPGKAPYADVDGVQRWYSSDKGLTIVNTMETTEVSGTKTWADNDDQDGIRPQSVTVRLFNGATEVASTTATAANGWAYSFTNLPKYSSGQEISYTVTEDAVPGYTTTYDGFDIVNTHTPEKTSVSGSKTWADNDDQDGARPDSITVNLLANGTKVDSATVTAEDGWTYTFTGLDRYANGSEIVYTVTEDAVAGYTATYDGLDVVNTHTPETTSVSGSKTWADNDDQDGIRPQSVTVRLFNGATEVASATATAANNWSYSFENLPKYAGGELIEYTISEDAVAGYTAQVSGYDITNTHVPEKTRIAGSKTWNDANDQDGARPDSITVNLLANGEKVDSTTVSPDAKGNWSYEFTNLDRYENGTAIVYTITEDEVPGYETSVDGTNLVNTHVPATTQVSGSKTWEDNGNQDGVRPQSVTVRLFNGATEVASTTATAAGNWSYSFENLPKYAGGVEIPYTVVEDVVPDYQTTYDGFNIVNWHTPDKTSVSGKKTWNDANDQDGARPGSITVNLLANGTKVDSATATAVNGWAYEFADLDKYEGGREIVYTVEEEGVEGYEAAYSGFNIVNTHTPETTSISGTKTWVDNDDQDGARPDSVTVRLLADGDEVASRVVTAEDNWAFEFTGMPVYNAGAKITYTIVEDDVPGYEESVDGFYVTNTHTPEKTSVSGSKTWADNDDQDGARPDSITVNLLANGTKVDSATVSPDADGNWTYEFTDLDKFEDGTAIVYSVSEEAPDGYTATYNGYDITNTHTPETTGISGAKTWVDANDQDGARPGSITVHLLANGDEVDSVTTTAADNWAYSFTGLPVYKSGEAIEYTVTESAVAGYTASWDGYFITNTHTPETTEVKGKKTWSDADDQDGLRPDEITVRLYADGVEVDHATATADDDWSYSFTDLPKYKGGELVDYTVGEDEVEGYTAVVSGFNITNTHVPATTDVKVVKAWEDEGDYDGLRPGSVAVQLYADGAAVGEAIQLDAAHGWSYTWTGLDKFANGKEIEYRVDEVNGQDIVGYSASDAEFDEGSGAYVITNTHEVRKVSVNGVKTWSDANNQDGKRPESITVDLLANGSKVDDAVVTPADDGTWSFEFDDLDMYENGKEIVYTIAEEQVEGYTATITGDMHSGFVIDNAYAPEQTTMSVSKEWDDAGNQDGLRPDSIRVQLLANGERADVEGVEAEVELNEGNGWSYTWTGLDRYANGSEIAYTVQEDAIEGYAAEIAGSATAGFVLKNKHVPALVDVSADKVWDDAENQDGIRPNSIDVRLTAIADGEVIELEGVTMTATLNEANQWHFEWKDLPQKHDGAIISYTLAEVGSIEGYTGSVSSSQAPATETANSSIAFTVTNAHTPEVVDIPASKFWDDANDQDGKRPTSVNVVLYADGQPAIVDGGTASAVLDAANGWSFTWRDLPKYAGGTEIAYKVVEAAVPNGYQNVSDGTKANGYVVVNKHLPEVTGTSVRKVWDDAGDQDGIRPGSIMVQLNGPDGAYGDAVELNADNNWSYAWTDLPRYHAGVLAEYSVTEMDVPDDYTVAYSGDMADGLVITDSYTPGVTNVSVVKDWDDANNQDGKRPGSILVQLYADGVPSGEPVTLDASNNWAHQWTNLAQKAAGVDIAYTVSEFGTPTGYEGSVAGDATVGFTLKNKHEIEYIDIPVSKEWDDNGNQDGLRPGSVKVRLMNGDDEVATLTLDASNHWTGAFEHLPKYADGSEIRYTLVEDEVEGYTTQVEGSAAAGFTVTNVHVPAVTSARAQKSWDDADNQDGKRPAEIAVQLFADDAAYGEPVVLKAGNGWACQWDDLPLKQNGKEVEYSVVESGVPDDYTADVSGNRDDGFVITNSYTPGVRNISVTKAWDDADDQDGARPDSITVRLLADGEQVDVEGVESQVQLNASNRWTYTWQNLDQMKEGKDIAYTVEEVGEVEGYSATTSGSADAGYVITNKHVPETTSVEVSKDWSDDANRDGKRTSGVVVTLFADGVETAKHTVTPNTSGEWSYTFDNLPKYAAGSEIVYTIAEEAVDGYQTQIDGFTVANSHENEKTTVSGSKTWNDNENQDGTRPESITVRLFADGEEVASQEVTAASNWAYEFTGLNKFRDAGTPIVYTVAEDDVEGYVGSVSGFNVNNTLQVGGLAVTKHVSNTTTSGAFTFTVTLDDRNVNGEHGGMTFADGVATFELADGQTVTATDLPAGIGYTVTEADQAGYTATVTGGEGTIAVGEIAQASFSNEYKATAKVDFFAMKALNGRTLGAEEFSFDLLEDGTVIQSASNAGDGHARFKTIEYTMDDLGEHSYTMRETTGGAGGVTYDTNVYSFTTNVTDNGDGTLKVTYNGYNPDKGALFTNSYTPSGSVVLHARKLVDGANPAAGAYTFKVTDAQGNEYATAQNAADGTVTFPALTFKAAGTYRYLITEVVPDGAQTLGPNTVSGGVAYDTRPMGVTIEAFDNFDGTMRFETSYDNDEALFENTTVPDATFGLTAQKAIEGREFHSGDSFTFTVTADDENAPLPESTQQTITPTSGSTAEIDFGDITFTTADLGKTYTYTVSETGAGDTVRGLLHDPFSHWVKLTVVDAGDGTMRVVPQYQNDAEALTFTNTYTAKGEAELTAHKTLSGRSIADGEFFFELSGDSLPATLHASADSAGDVTFPAIPFTQADVGKEYHYTITETQGTRGGVTYDTTSHEAVVRVLDNGDGTLSFTYEYDGETEPPEFQNEYSATGTSAVLTAHKALVGGTLEGGEFEFMLTGTSANAASTAQRAFNDAEGNVVFETIEYDTAGVYEYNIVEAVPADATVNADGAYVGPDGIVYDGDDHTATVTVTDDGEGALHASVAYDDNASGISFGNTELVRTGFTFNKYYFGGVGSFDFKLTAADASGAPRSGVPADYSSVETIVDDGSQAFTATVQNGPFQSGAAEVVFPEISFVDDGDYYYLVQEDEQSTATMTVDEAQYLVHVTVEDNEVVSTTYELLYDGQNLGETSDLSFYNNSKVKLGLQSLSVQSYSEFAERTSVYPKAKKYLNDSTDQLVGGEFSFELIDDATGAVLAAATNDEVGNVAFFDEDSDPGLVYSEPGTYHYTMREVAGDEADITYDPSAVSVTVTVVQGDEGLEATTTYNGPGGGEPAFYNVKRGMDVTVQKVSRYGGEGLVDCTYALWMVGEDGDALIKEATSDGNGYITFTDVTLLAGQKYYFKEVEAPKGHTVDPYRTAYFSLNAAGDGLVLVEATAPDGWHSATENIDTK